MHHLYVIDIYWYLYCLTFTVHWCSYSCIENAAIESSKLYVIFENTPLWVVLNCIVDFFMNIEFTGAADLLYVWRQSVDHDVVLCLLHVVHCNFRNRQTLVSMFQCNCISVKGSNAVYVISNLYRVIVNVILLR